MSDSINKLQGKAHFEAYTQRVRLILGFIALTMLVMWILPSPARTDVPGYLPLHVFFETLAIVIAAMVFLVGWNSFRIKPDYRLLILSVLFLGVAILEFFHMLSVEGMPDFVTPGSPEKGINYWLAARLFAGVALLSMALVPRRIPTEADRYRMLAAVIAALLLINIWFLYFPNTTPAAFIVGPDSATARIAVEFVLVVLYGTAGALLWRRAQIKRKLEILMLASAALVLAMSELFFSLNAAAGDLYNLIGHVFKVVAYSYLFRSVVVSGINQPFREVAKLNSRIRATLDALPDMLFEIAEDGTIHDYHSHAAEADLVAPPEMFLGRNMREFLPAPAVTVFHKAMSQISNTGRATGLEYALMMPTGEHWFELSGASLSTSDTDVRYILLVRDITKRHVSETRTSKLLQLAAEAPNKDEATLAREAIDLMEELTHSNIGFLHLVNDDQVGIELLAWSTRTAEMFCHTQHNNHYPVDQAGIWADCIEARAPVIVNDYESATNKKGLPEGHSALTRFITVPVLEGHETRLIAGVGNCDFDYTDESVKTVQLIANELYQIILRRRAQGAAERSQRIMRAALDHLPIGVAINSVDSEVHFEYMNDNFPRFYRTSREALASSGNFWDVVYEDPEQREQMRAKVIADFTSGDPERMRWFNVPIPRNGEELRYVNAQNVVVPEDGLSVSLVTDVTESLRADAELRIAATAFASHEGIMITDAQRNILRVNKSFEKSSGFTQQELQGLSPALFRSGRQSAEFYEAMWDQLAKTDTWTGEVWNRRKNGEVYPQTLTITAVRNEAGVITNYVGDYIDLTELKHAEQTISKLSFFDSLTGLPNREKFLSMLNDSVCMAVKSGRYAALLMIDLDHFKDINDTMGHSAGDELLVNVAERLQRLIRPEDSIARYGGDEFVMILNALDTDPGRAASLVQKISQSVLAILHGSYLIGSEHYYLTCSIGTTLYGPLGADAAELLKQADIALFRAKDDGRDRVGFFDPAWQAAISERAQWLTDLREGIDRHEFELYLQAQQDSGGIVIGAEALVRWNHPQRGLVSPVEFIPLAEETGLILPLGKEIMQLGLSILKHWQESPEFSQLKLSINVSPQQFYEQDFAQMLASQITELSIDASKVILEFTESTLIDNIEQAQKVMNFLSALGVNFAIDDFGTGYSSLAYLSKLPVHQLKIDQSFVRHMGAQQKDNAIVRTIIDMAHTLDMQVLAEGVETLEQRDALDAFGCTLHQGYFISRPLPLPDFEAFLAHKKVPG